MSVNPWTSIPASQRAETSVQLVHLFLPTDCCRLSTRRGNGATGRIPNDNKSPSMTSRKQLTKALTFWGLPHGKRAVPLGRRLPTCVAARGRRTFSS
ncbi:hypothetical protein AVEN_243415-1 [Araneus ventricosus]|uniref:Uncharacterized protein n=1 Tax=Araneus ventricosus TaxID=182803 RepID=A0A4Y2G643_ARAVE|nr:hypothetical protein AVEN_243415-1 [Araneus ventricosus]